MTLMMNTMSWFLVISVYGNRVEYIMEYNSNTVLAPHPASLSRFSNPKRHVSITNLSWVEKEHTYPALLIPGLACSPFHTWHTLARSSGVPRCIHTLRHWSGSKASWTWNNLQRPSSVLPLTSKVGNKFFFCSLNICVCVYVCIYVCVCIHVYMCVYVYMYVYICV